MTKEVNWQIYIANEKGLSPYAEAETRKEAVFLRQRAALEMRAQSISGKVHKELESEHE